jgi:hypothetical protein
MELKRIIARDTRAANEKAVALYGPDVLVISSSKVRGQTELIVAVDIPPMSVEAAVAEAFVPTDKTYALPETGASETPASFGQVLDQTMARQKRPAKTAKTEMTEGFVPASTLKAQAVIEPEPEVQVAAPTVAAAPVVAPVAAPVVAAPAIASSAVQAAQEERDMVRGKEIVDMVREELASLRKEFKLSQQLAWQGAGLSVCCLCTMPCKKQRFPQPCAPCWWTASKVLKMSILRWKKSAANCVIRCSKATWPFPSKVCMRLQALRVPANPSWWRVWRNTPVSLWAASKWRSSVTAINGLALGTKPSC